MQQLIYPFLWMVFRLTNTRTPCSKRVILGVNSLRLRGSQPSETIENIIKLCYCSQCFFFWIEWNISASMTISLVRCLCLIQILFLSAISLASHPLSLFLFLQTGLTSFDYDEHTEKLRTKWNWSNNNNEPKKKPHAIFCFSLFIPVCSCLLHGFSADRCQLLIEIHACRSTSPPLFGRWKMN